MTAALKSTRSGRGDGAMHRVATAATMTQLTDPRTLPKGQCVCLQIYRELPLIAG